MTVTPPNTAPSVSISSPANGATFTAPASIVVSAAASDSDGSVASVAVLRERRVARHRHVGAVHGRTGRTLAPATYVLTAVATDNSGETTTSAPVTITVLAIPNRLNMALASNGGIATASSILNANYPPSGAINGDRRGLNWGAGGGWNDGTPNAWPDWIEVAFNGPKTIDEINVFSMQDNYTAPVEPTPTMTFASVGHARVRGAVLDRHGVAGHPGRRGHQQQPGVAPVGVRARSPRHAFG